MQVQKDQKKVVRCTTIKSGFTFFIMKWPVEFIRKVGLFYIPPFFLSKQATSKRRKNCKSSCCCLFPLPQIVEQSRAKKCKRLQKKQKFEKSFENIFDSETFTGAYLL
jgi:hypothetical protein